MGDRAMCEIEINDNERLYFYTHWYGSDLPEIARKALAQAKNRLYDPPYATRIIIDQLIKHAGNRDSEVGSGIMLTPCCEDYYGEVGEPSVKISIPDNRVYIFRET